MYEIRLNGRIKIVLFSTFGIPFGRDEMKGIDKKFLEPKFGCLDLCNLI